MADDAATSGGEPDVVYLRPLQSHTQVERIAMVVGLVTGVLLAGLVGWLGFTAYEAHNLEAQRNLFVQSARDAAEDLLTVDYRHADADAQRILDSATGKFHDSFARRKQSYVDNAQRMRSKLVATATDAGLESRNGDQGKVLVAVTVRSSDPAQAQQEPHFWRLRVTVKKMGDVAKVSDVVFVS
ncbi:mammalian cell entry protein [Candidatus Mycobacterium methanotrophicum]|uniref:Mammalian cell entry protein n=1 Tax=Candidatus Mycobacterium methanotrophicum TaxID=2943498 RepID=A0ABY4QKU2_9MYCO|nr:mammalian cell entry protein [Candidatus Mycobacterium methanotrophicum]UQX10413.1 mammalian cell entry protein [Candidatus Mycobacterium methanotrophicum]